MAQLLLQIPSELEEPGTDVSLELAGAQNLRNRARRLTAPQLELEETVARRVPPLTKEQVVLGLGVDVADSPTVDQDLDGLVEAVRFEEGRLLGVSDGAVPNHRKERERRAAKPTSSRHGISNLSECVPPYTSCTVVPPTTVRTTWISLIRSGSTSCGSSARITKSPSLPAVIVPFSFSSKEAWAPFTVHTLSA